MEHETIEIKTVVEDVLGKSSPCALLASVEVLSSPCNVGRIVNFVFLRPRSSTMVLAHISRAGEDVEEVVCWREYTNHHSRWEEGIADAIRKAKEQISEEIQEEYRLPDFRISFKGKYELRRPRGVQNATGGFVKIIW